MALHVRRPPRWAQLLPATLALLVALVFAGYLLFTPVTSLLDGTPASALDARNPLLLGLAVLVVAGATAGLGAAVARRDRLLWTTTLALGILGALPFALGPQVWIVALLLAVGALLGRVDSDAPSPLVVAAALVLPLVGLLWLTAVTGPPGAGRLAAVVGVGTVGAVLSALVRSG